MFCYQCEQTADGKGCSGRMGVCGKTSDTAELQDQLTGALIGLAKAVEGNEYKANDATAALVVEGLFATLTNVNFDNADIRKLIDRAEKEKQRLTPGCFSCEASCGKMMIMIWQISERAGGCPFPAFPDPVRYPRHGGVCLSCGSAGVQGRCHSQFPL